MKRRVLLGTLATAILALGGCKVIKGRGGEEAAPKKTPPTAEAPPAETPAVEQPETPPEAPQPPATEAVRYDASADIVLAETRVQMVLDKAKAKQWDDATFCLQQLIALAGVLQSHQPETLLRVAADKLSTVQASDLEPAKRCLAQLQAEWGYVAGPEAQVFRTNTKVIEELAAAVSGAEPSVQAIQGFVKQIQGAALSATEEQMVALTDALVGASLAISRKSASVLEVELGAAREALKSLSTVVSPPAPAAREPKASSAQAGPSSSTHPGARTPRGSGRPAKLTTSIPSEKAAPPGPSKPTTKTSR